MNKILIFCLTFLLFHSAWLLAETSTSQVEESEKILIKLDKAEKLPKEIRLSKPDASVMFVNATKDSPLTLEVEFGDRDAHCATANLKWNESEKKIKSSEPIAPKNFAGMCFPASGIYKVNIYGLNKDGTVARTAVIAP